MAWGVYVRASKSGDGCGSHWPLCDGASVPMNGMGAKLVEMSHRASTEFTGVLAIVLLAMAWRWFPRGSQPRRAALAAFGFVCLEGAIGWALVRYQLVTTNSSGDRAAVMSFHVVSTFLLMSALVATAYTGTGRRIRLRGQGSVGWVLASVSALVAGLGVTGAISALGHTLDPVKNVVAAAKLPTTFWMVRVQPYHPYLAIAVGLFSVLAAAMVSNLRPSPAVGRAAAWFAAAYVLELAIGFVNVELLAPIAVQMIHLAAADAVVIALALFAATALTEGTPQAEGEHASSVRLPARELVGEYVRLTKPRIISLLLLTTVAALFAGVGGWPGLETLAAVCAGGYLMCGSANAMNMVVERDLDDAMERTRSRPTVSRRIPANRAFAFALILAFAAFAILAAGANLLAACLALAGEVYYVCVYTLGLKRRTWNNIVIGGAAGAFPPLVGWAAGRDGLAPLAYFMFAIVFLWTPVHFWALAILLKDDYAKAGVPMLPVVKGVAHTAAQIAGYAALTVAVTLAPVAFGLVGWPYAVAAAGLNVYLGVLTWRLWSRPEPAQARGLFHYSMLYLAILFLAVAVDRAHSAAPRPGVSSATAARGGLVAALGDSGSPEFRLPTGTLGAVDRARGTHRFSRLGDGLISGMN